MYWIPGTGLNDYDMAAEAADMRAEAEAEWAEATEAEFGPEPDEDRFVPENLFHAASDQDWADLDWINDWEVMRGSR